MKADKSIDSEPQNNAMKRVILRFAFMLGMAAGAMGQASPPGYLVSGDQNWSLEGTITDASGKPLAGVQIRAEAREGSSTVTDGGGHYLLKGTKSGRYGVFAKKDGYVRTRIRFMQLLPAMRVRLDLKLDREGVLSGRVFTQDGEPLAGVQVVAWAREFRDGRLFFAFRGGGKTDNVGQYLIRGLSEGSYFVGEVPHGVEVHTYSSSGPKQVWRSRLTYPPLFYPGVQSFDEASPIHLRNSEQREGVDLILEKVPAFCIIGSISFNGLGPESQEATIMLTETEKSWRTIVGGGPVRAGQKFEICDLVPGIHYTLISQTWGVGMKVLGFAERDFEGNKRDAELERPLNFGVLSMQPGEPVKGKLTIDPGQQDDAFPKGVLVILENMTSLPGYSNESRDTQVASTGEFLLPNVFPYAHSLRILNLPSGYYVKQAVCDHNNLLQEPWRPGCGELHIVVGVDAATITGQAIDENGQPITDADVILVPKESEAKIAVRTVDQGGHFQFSSVIPGAYNIMAITGLPEGEAQNPNAVRNYLAHSTDLNLASRGRQSLTLTVLKVGQ